MEQQDSVKVFNFRAFDADANEMRIVKFKATREAIVTRFDGEVLEGTDHHVAPGELDDQGRYRRIATGWGELG